MSSDQQSPADRAPRNTPYVKPRLLRFGDVSEMTQAKDDMGKADGGGSMADKT